MKKLRLYILFGILAVAFVLLVACSTPRLAKPENVEIFNKTIFWSAVENARGYTVDINGEEHEIRRTSYSFDGIALAEGTYTFKVKACGDGVNYTDSAWSTVEYEQRYESGLVYTLSEDEKSYEITSVESAVGDVIIEDTYNGLPVTAIGRLAFNNNINVVSVVLGKNIRSIGERAFYGCVALESITLNEGLETIDSAAFQSCRCLTTLVIPDSVTDIGEDAFAFCRGLTDIDIGAGVKSIGSKVFQTNIALTSVTVPSNVEILGDQVFDGCTGLKKVVFDGFSGTAGIADFQGCTSLTEIDFGDGAMAIGAYMFGGCTALETVNIPDTVTTVGVAAFVNCAALKDISIGRNVPYIAQRAFAATAAYEDCTDNIVLIDGWIVDIKNSDYVTEDDFTAMLNEDIIGIAERAFYGCNNFNNVQLPESLRFICNDAFRLCGGLYTVRINKNAEIIGDNAFFSCSQLSAVEISGEGLKSIGGYAFANTNLRSVGLPSSVTSIGTYAFYNTTYWKEQYTDSGIVTVDNWIVGCNPQLGGFIELDDGIVGIADYAFSYCTGLASVSLPDSVKYIGEGAFYGCTGADSEIGMFLTNVPPRVTEIRPFTYYRSGVYMFTLPSTVNTIGYSAFAGSLIGAIEISDNVTMDAYAFWGCEYLTKVTLGEGMTSIPTCAFSGCISLESVSIPDSVESIGNYAFFNCSAMTELSMGSGVKAIGNYAFYMCSGLSSIELPSNVVSIGAYAFYKCTGATILDLGDSLESIGDYAFYGCAGITNVTLPIKLAAIGESAFRACASLTNVMLHSVVTDIGIHAFYGNKLLTIYSEATAEYIGWNSRWNSSFRPVVYNCVFDVNKEYVVSVIKTKIANYNAINGISAPTRGGYVFVGWAIEQGSDTVDYTAEELYLAPDGTTLYAVWEVAPEPETPGADGGAESD